MEQSGYVPLTIAHGIRCAARAQPDKLAVQDSDGGARSYGELVDRMTRVGAFATGHGLECGDIVALVAPNRLDYIEIVAGLSEQGIIVATLSPILTPEELAAIIADCQPRLILAAPDIELPDNQIEVLRLGHGFDAAIHAVPEPARIPVLDERHPFAIAYTSGTTGQPKGVLLSHRSRCLLFGAMAAEYGCFGRDDHFLGLAPLCHGAGLAFALAPLFHGGRCTLVYSSKPQVLLESLARYEPNGIFVVPTHLQRLYAADPNLLAQYRGRHRLKTIISNAAALSPALKQATVDYFGTGLLHETYGSTEGGIVTNIRPDSLLRKPRSVGRAITQMLVEVRREDGSTAGPGETGELFCRSPFSFNGYLNRPEETAATLVDGWVTVGDLAFCDEDGDIFITDRKKDMIVSGGINVYPGEVEATVERFGGVLECAVIGQEDEEWGESLHAFIVVQAGQKVERHEIIDYCRRHLAPYKVPKHISFLAELPRNSSGKLVKRVLRDRANSA